MTDTADLAAALRHYAELGPVKMERWALDCIRDAARLVIAAQSMETQVADDFDYVSPGPRNIRPLRAKITSDWDAGAEAMREEAALYMDSEEHSGYADAIRFLPLPRRPA